MEINTQQIESLFHLQEQAQLPRPKTQEASGFQTILNQQMNQKDASPVNQTANAQSVLLGQLMMDKTSDKDMDADTAVLQAAFEEASGTLDLWDTYTQTLGRSSSDTALKDAYAILEGIDSRVSQLRANPAVSSNAAIDDILSELEIMSATEKFKFNRGDYLG